MREVPWPRKCGVRFLGHLTKRLCGRACEVLRWRRNAHAAALMILALAVEARADELTVGKETTLWELVRPDRFGWPAVFTCNRARGDRSPAVVFGKDPDDMNERLVAAGIWPEDCHGGFSIRSTRPQRGKIEEIKGNVGSGAR
jgi:hypothetical protein